VTETAPSGGVVKGFPFLVAFEAFSDCTGTVFVDCIFNLLRVEVIENKSTDTTNEMAMPVGYLYPSGYAIALVKLA
jgi:hypothetical protein